MATMPGPRPLGLGEILDVGMKLYVRHWRTLMGCVVWIVLPVQIIAVVVLFSIAPEQLDITSSDTGIDPGEEGRFIVAQAVVGLLEGLVYLVSVAACFKAVADAYVGHEPSARGSLAFGLHRLPALVALALLTTFGIVLALFALVVPAIWLAVAWTLAIPALLLEGVGPPAALRRSFRLVQGRWWRVALTLVVGVVLVSFLAGMIQVVLVAIPTVVAGGNDGVAAVATVVANTIGGVITMPFTAAVVALVYVDQRVRNEGFDLHQLADGLGVERGPDAPSAPPLVAPEVSPEVRAQAPYWPPPPGWQPPQPPAEEEWQPPRPPPWPPEPPDHGSGGV